MFSCVCLCVCLVVSVAVAFDVAVVLAFVVAFVFAVPCAFVVVVVFLPPPQPPIPHCGALWIFMLMGAGVDGWGQSAFSANKCIVVFNASLFAEVRHIIIITRIDTRFPGPRHPVEGKTTH